MSETLWNRTCTYRNALYDMLVNVDPNIGGETNDDYERYLLFTTYKLDIQLFEEQILAGMPGLDNAGTLRKNSRCRSVNKWLSRVNTTILYDAGGRINAIKRSAVEAVQVYVTDGVFHPKIALYAYGNTAEGYDIGLIVGSANLTRNGIAENIESLYTIKLGTEGLNIIRGKVAEDISQFLVELNRKSNGYLPKKNSIVGELIRILDSVEKKAMSGYTGYRFLWTMPGIQSESITTRLQSILNKCSDFIAFSPYMNKDRSNDIELPWILHRLPEMGDDAVYLCPAPGVENPDMYCLSKEFYSVCKRKFGSQCWKVYKPFLTGLRNKACFAHAKLYRITSENEVYLIIGSHNLTNAAWKTGSAKVPEARQNIEASLLIECTDNFKKLSEKPDYGQNGDFRDLDSDFIISEENEEGYNEVEKRVRHFTSYNWKTQELTIIVEPAGNDPLDMIYSANWLEKELQFKMNEGLRITISHGIDSNKLSKQPIYTIKFNGADSEQYFNLSGFIIELNMESRPAGFSSLKELLEYYETGQSDGEYDEDENEEGNYEGNLPHEERSLISCKKESNGKGVFFSVCNWYDFFSQLKKLRDSIAVERKNARIKSLLEICRVFCIDASKLQEISDDEVKNQLILLWLTGREINQMISPLISKEYFRIKEFIGEYNKIRTAFENQLRNYPFSDIEKWVDSVSAHAESLSRKLARSQSTN